MNGETVLVTGGAGFIGSNLVDLLMEREHAVIVLDNLSSGKVENLERWMEDPRFKFIQGDVTRPLSEVLTPEKLRSIPPIKTIFHLAARVDVTSSFEDPRADLMTNYMGTMNVLDHSLKHDVKKVVFSSSAAVYGDTTELPVTEGSIKEPLSPYGLHKLMSENLMEIYRKQWGLSTVSLRFFNVYGPRQDPSNPYSGVISKFISSAISDEPLIIFGDGEQTRDFIYVGDIAQAMYLAASSRICGSFNAGTGRETSINELASNTKKASNSKSQIVKMPARKGEILRSCAEVSSLKDAVDFEAEKGLQEGLRRTIDHIRREG